MCGEMHMCGFPSPGKAAAAQQWASEWMWTEKWTSTRDSGRENAMRTHILARAPYIRSAGKSWQNIHQMIWLAGQTITLTSTQTII